MFLSSIMTLKIPQVLFFCLYLTMSQGARKFIHIPAIIQVHIFARMSECVRFAQFWSNPLVKLNVIAEYSSFSHEQTDLYVGFQVFLVYSSCCDSLPSSNC